MSVVIPCYNYGRYLPACTASALDQEGVDVDVIIVDDASTDDSADVARRLAAQDPRISVLARPDNRGLVATLNEGIAAATAPYIAVLSSDDLLAPGSLARSTAVLDAQPSVGLVYGFAPVFVDKPPRSMTLQWSWTVWTGAQWLEEVCRRARNVMCSPEAIMRATVLRATGGYEPAMSHTCDFFMWLSAAAHADVAYVDGPDQAYYRVHGQNMSVQHFGSDLADITERRRTIELFLDRYGDRFPDAGRWRAEAMAALGREALGSAAKCYDRGLPAGEDPIKLAELAETIWPGIRQTSLWTAYQRKQARWEATRRRSPIQVARCAIEDAAFRVGRKLTLRRFAHFGI